MSDQINYAAGDAEYTVMDAALNLRVQILPYDHHGRDITAGMIRSKYSQGTKQKTSSTMSCNNNKQNQKNKTKNTIMTSHPRHSAINDNIIIIIKFGETR